MILKVVQRIFLTLKLHARLVGSPKVRAVYWTLQFVATGTALYCRTHY